MLEKLAEEYKFDDFTTTAYREYLQIAKSRYTFKGFHDFDKNERFVIWRHDVDLSMQRALRLAQIEHEEGIQATYFILPHSEYYNLFEKEISDLVLKIRDLGHHIGLHFDTHYYGIKDEQSLERHLAEEVNWLNNIFNIEIKAFSFHNTNEFTMNCKAWSYAGIINAYANYFQSEVEYCSDSNGYWRFERLRDVLEKSTSDRLQILTHPEWWQENAMSPWEKIQLCIDSRARRNKNLYIEALIFFNSKNIGYEE